LVERQVGAVAIRFKSEGKCKASGNIYEEVLEVVCVEAYNRVLEEWAKGRLGTKRKTGLLKKNDTLDILIKETVDQMKNAGDERLSELKKDLNSLLAKRTAVEWDAAPLDLSHFETEKLKRYFEANPKQMTELDVEKFKAIFAGIIASEPGKLKLILKNGNELLQEYKPMKGQVNNAKKCRSYTCKADKRT
jgi:hypothetical protein